ncbi:M14 family metallopeptidase [Roseomonas elaeocarpi]|uniref:Succinylglutamate desuccinylase/aspartoacylase family protein n=1 Tax=Roseomonas elaeocarpi TaxID=907779 RepID=A0ABV6JS99_9PROT
MSGADRSGERQAWHAQGWTLPHFPVRVPVPDLTPFLAGNVLPGVWSFAAPLPGPHVAVVALIHGNEIAGAAVLARWLHAGLRPECGRLSLIFANLAAFARFDPRDPIQSRYVDEDMNRVWARQVLEGPRRSEELRRARELLPLLLQVDVLLDLHSTLWPSAPLVLCGETARARSLALALGTPRDVVADGGHPEGRRLLEHARFADPDGKARALLAEGGQHWEPGTDTVLEQTATRLLTLCGQLPAPARPPPRGVAWQVTRRVVPRRRDFAFLRPFRGGDVIARRNTLIALDGEDEIRTPHDDCLLVLPGQAALPGQTAVRLARRVTA